MKQTSSELINAAARNLVVEIRRQSLNACFDKIFDKAEKIRKVTDSTEAWEIYLGSCGKRFIKMVKLRQNLESKIRMLEELAGEVAELQLKY